MNRKILAGILVGMGLFAAIAVSLLPRTSEERNIRVGVILPLTGDVAFAAVKPS